MGSIFPQRSGRRRLQVQSFQQKKKAVVPRVSTTTNNTNHGCSDLMTCWWWIPTKPAASTTSSLQTPWCVWRRKVTGVTSACPSGTESTGCGRPSTSSPSSGTSGCWRLSPGEFQQRPPVSWSHGSCASRVVVWQVEQKCAGIDFWEEVPESAGDPLQLCPSV